MSCPGPDGRIHRFRYRLWRAPTGIMAEATEIDQAPEEGYHGGVLGSHEADRLTWTQFGRALEPFEGWAFRLTFERTDTLEDGDG